MLDYLPLIIGFAAAAVGIWGKSWDEGKRGFRRVTAKGWVTISLAFLSFVVASVTVYGKNARLAKLAEVRTAANAQVREGIAYLLRHLADRNLARRGLRRLDLSNHGGHRLPRQSW